MTDGWGIFAAISTAASALIIAWQAVLTRKSVKASEDSVEIATKALSAAERSADVAEQTLRAGEMSRLDDRAADLSIPTASFLPLRVQRGTPSLLFFLSSWSDLPPETTFKLPRDKDVWLSAAMVVEVLNHGSRTVRAQINVPNSQVVGVVAEPGVASHVEVSIRLTVGKWIEAIGDGGFSEPGKSSPTLQIRLYQRGHRDAEVELRIQMNIFGSVLRAVPDAAGDWVLCDPNNPLEVPRVYIDRPERIYWKSVSRNETY